MADPNARNPEDDLASKMSRASILEEELHSCAACDGDAKLRCQACFYNESITQQEHRPTWYCNKECQKKDWPMHKAHCREISNTNQLYRGARLVQDAFYNSRRHGFDIPIDRYTVEGTKMRIYQGGTGTRVLFDFPTRLVKQRDDEEALLAFSACENAIAGGHHMFKLAFEGKTIFPRFSMPTKVARDLQEHQRGHD